MKYYVRIRATTNEKWQRHTVRSDSEIQNLVNEHLRKNKVLRLVVKEIE